MRIHRRHPNRGIAIIIVTASPLAAAGRPVVVVTTSLIATAVRDVAGDAVDIETLMPAGTCPGQFDLEPQQVRRVRTAVLVIRHDMQGFLDTRFAAAGVPADAVIAPAFGEPFNVPTNYAKYCTVLAAELARAEAHVVRVAVHGRARLPAARVRDPQRAGEVVERHDRHDAVALQRCEHVVVVRDRARVDAAARGLDAAPLEREPVRAVPVRLRQREVRIEAMVVIARVPAAAPAAHDARALLEPPPVVEAIAALDLVRRGRGAPSAHAQARPKGPRPAGAPIGRPRRFRSGPRPFSDRPEQPGHRRGSPRVRRRAPGRETTPSIEKTGIPMAVTS